LYNKKTNNETSTTEEKMSTTIAEPKNVQAAHVSLEDEVITALRRRNVPFEDWGKVGASKPLDKLIEVLKEGEVKWNYKNPSDNTFHIDSVVIHVRCCMDDVNYELREDYRQFRNGYRDYRREWDGSMSKKIKAGETDFDTAIRGLAEELGQSESGFKDRNNYSLSKLHSEGMGPRPTKSHPPFEAIYHRRIFRCIIQEKLFRSEYILVDPLKTTYFKWLPL
jgi:hypothetical protein